MPRARSVQPAALAQHLLGAAYRSALLIRSVQRRIARPTEVGVRALVMRGREVLLIRHRSGARPWGLPGGGARRQEPLVAAVQRELREEAGCPVTVERLHGVFHSFQHGLNVYTAVFICTPLGEPAPPRFDLEIDAAMFASIDALPAGLEHGSRRRISEYINGLAAVSGEW